MGVLVAADVHSLENARLNGCTIGFLEQAKALSMKCDFHMKIF